MSMKMKPISPDLLVAIFDITLLLEKYKNSNGPLIQFDQDDDGEPIELPEAEVDMMYGVHNSILWNEISCDGNNDSHHLPMEDLLHYFHKNNLEVRCTLHFKNHKEEVEGYQWISDIIFSEKSNKELQTAALEIQSRGDIEVSLTKCWNLVSGLFQERRNLIHEKTGYQIQAYAQGGAHPWINRALEGRFLSLDLLSTKNKLLPALNSFIADYIDHFTKKEIDWGQTNIKQWSKQKEYLMEEFRLSTEEFGFQFWIPLFTSSVNGIKRIESIIALALEGGISIESIGSKRSERRFILMAEIRMPATKHVEVRPKPNVIDTKKSGAVLEITKDNYGSICVNNIVLRTPTAGSPTDNLMVMLLDNGKTELDAALIKEVKAGARRPISNIVSDLVKGPIRKLFFPKISEKKLTFRRTVFQEELDRAGLILDNVIKEMSQLKKVEMSGKKSKRVEKHAEV